MLLTSSQTLNVTLTPNYLDVTVIKQISIDFVLAIQLHPRLILHWSSKIDYQYCVLGASVFLLTLYQPQSLVSWPQYSIIFRNSQRPVRAFRADS